MFIVTDNTGSPDFSLFKGRHWGGYHFPRHTYLFNRRNLGLLLEKLGMQVESVRSAISPVNWVYSIRNWIDDWRGPRWMVRNLSLQSSIALGLGTVIDTFWVAFGRGAILHGLFRKPLADRQTPNTPIEVES